jgi:peptidoglycan/xylan/chitin deacetylase (PgdA/CDA1 family)
MSPIRNTEGQWAAYEFRATAPPDAATVSLWVHSYSSVSGTADVDDFDLKGIAPGAEPILPTPYKAPPKEQPIDPASIPPRGQPPIIILKLDDLKQHHGKPLPHWDRVTAYLDARGIKGSIGVICQTLAEATPQYMDWIRTRHASGNWEFWFHGWDHAGHKVDGKSYNEFKMRPYEEQKKRFDDAQRLAQEKLGFAFQTFGPPGGAASGMFDETTIRVMADDPHMKVWLYPQPIDAAGKQLETAGKVTILDRVWAVNLESAVGHPDLQAFLRGYAKNLDREYFVLQGHPAAWSDERFEEFGRIIDFLVQQKAVFMTPIEYAATRSQNAPATP